MRMVMVMVMVALTTHVVEMSMHCIAASKFDRMLVEFPYPTRPTPLCQPPTESAHDMIELGPLNTTE